MTPPESSQSPAPSPADPRENLQAPIDLAAECARLQHQVRLLEAQNIRLQNENRDHLNLTTHHVRTSLVNIRGFGKELDHACQNIKESLVHEESVAHLKARVLNLLQSDIAESLHYIHRGVDHCENFLQALTVLSRLLSLPIRIAEVATTEVVKGVLRNLAIEFRKRDIACQVETLPPCRTDRALLATALRAILENAARYSDPRKVGVVQIRGEASAHTYRIFIQDNGIGIPIDQQDRVFELLQGVREAHEHRSGLGIGLTLARKAMEILGGAVTLESQPDRGTTVCLHIPQGENSLP